MRTCYSLLAGFALALLATYTAQAQASTLPVPAADTAAAGITRTASPELPWWLPNAKECAAIRAEEARTAPRQPQRRKKQLRHWAEEQPEPDYHRP